MDALILLPIYAGLLALAGYLLEHHRQMQRTDKVLEVLLKRIPVREPTEAEIKRAMSEEPDFMAAWRALEYGISEDRMAAMNDIVRVRVRERLHAEQRRPW